MAIESAIRSILVADSDTNDLVSGRIYPYMRQQGSSFPAIVYNLDNTEPQECLGGDLSLTRATLTLSCIAETYSDSKNLSAKSRIALNGYTGTSELVSIKSCFHDNSTAYVEDSEIGNDRGVSIVEDEYIVWFVN